jgi:hypothetical protein
MPDLTYIRLIQKYLKQGNMPPEGIIQRFGIMLVKRKIKRIANAMGIDINTLQKHQYPTVEKNERKEL